MNSTISKLAAYVNNRVVFPELRAARDIYRPSEWELIGKVAIEYLRVIQQISSVSESDIEILKQYEQVRGRPSYVLGLLEADSQALTKLSSELLHYLDTEDENFKAAVTNLQHMMTNAQKLKKKGIDPHDGSYLADNAIWGYTKIISAEAQMHFVLCHFLERLASVVMEQSMDTEHKDWLLNAMSELILLNSAKSGFPGHDWTFSLWSTSKADGGLGWIGQSSLQAMQKVVSVEG